MAGDVQIFDHAERIQTYPAPTVTVSGDVMANGAFPVGFDLWTIRADLQAGAQIAWKQNHGDEALYVLSGELRWGDEVCGPGAVVIVDSGVATQVQVIERADVLHCGTWATEPPSTGLRGPVVAQGHGVAVVGAAGIQQESHTRDDGSELTNTMFADPFRPTCRLDLFRVSGSGAAVFGSHSHSEDELIHVTQGTLQVGRDAVTAGMTIAVRGGRRYGFRTPGPYEFINYRADISTIVKGNEKVPKYERAGRLVLARLDAG